MEILPLRSMIANLISSSFSMPWLERAASMTSASTNRAWRRRSRKSLPFSTIIVGSPSISLDNQPERCLSRESPTSMAISVTMTSIALVKEKSSPSSACWVASLIIINRTKSKVVSSANERRPAILNSTMSATYIAAARNTESIGSPRGK
ncbi:hypothetical protein D9M70_604230 [compost metagenome]